MTTAPAKLRNDKLWKAVYKLAQDMYAKSNDMNAEFPEEQWRSAGKLRSSANDALFYVSQAIGQTKQEMSLYDWNSTHKHLFAVQSMYTFAAKQKFIELDPEVVLLLDDLLTQVDQRITAANQAIKDQDAEDLEPWMEKYRIWQKLQNK